MKNRVLTFIIGVLVGAIIATIGFFIYAKTIRNNRPVPPMRDFEKGQMQPRERGEMSGMSLDEMPNNN